MKRSGLPDNANFIQLLFRRSRAWRRRRRRSRARSCRSRPWSTRSWPRVRCAVVGRWRRIARLGLVLARSRGVAITIACRRIACSGHTWIRTPRAIELHRSARGLVIINRPDVDRAHRNYRSAADGHRGSTIAKRQTGFNWRPRPMYGKDGLRANGANSPITAARTRVTRTTRARKYGAGRRMPSTRAAANIDDINAATPPRSAGSRRPTPAKA